MRNKGLLFIALALVVSLAPTSLFAQSSSKSKMVTQSAQLIFIVNVANARVAVDNIVAVGNRITVAIGPHTVTATAPGYQDYSQRIDVRTNTTIRIELQPATYLLTVNSPIKGITVFIDGVQISGTTYNVTPGNHTVRVKAPGYQDYTTSVNVAGPVVVNAQFTAMSFPLRVISNVKVYTIFIDGAQISGNSLNVTSGNHAVRVSAAGYIDYQTTVNVAGPTVVNAQLTSMSFTLTFAVNVKDVTIFVDGAEIYGTVIYVQPGSHTIRMIANGYQEYTTMVEVSGPMTVNAKLVQSGYALSVTSNVHGAMVTINNIDKGETPFSAVMPPGSYTVVVSAPGFTSYTTSVNLNGPITISARLAEEQPASMNLVLPRGFLDPQGKEFNQIRVYIDGRIANNVKKDFTDIHVPSGRHKISVSSGDLYVQSGDIDFAGGTTYTIELFMELRVKASR